MNDNKPTPDPRAQPCEGDDTLGVWVAICPVYGWDHAAVYNDPMTHVNCPFCWRFWGDEKPCEIRRYAPESEVERLRATLETAKWKLIEVRSQAGTALDAMAKAEHDAS